jgi:hypothetical protein
LQNEKTTLKPQQTLLFNPPISAVLDSSAVPPLLSKTAFKK